MTYEIRRLGPADAEAYRLVRLDALRLHPEAFSVSGVFHDEELMALDLERV